MKCLPALFAAFLASAAVAGGQTRQPLLLHSFDEETHGWVAMGVNARVSINQQTTFNGRGALRLDYDIKQGALSLAVCPTPAGTMARARAFRFWLNADHPTTCALIVQEDGGGRFLAPFFAPKGKWQKVEIAVDEFALLEGPGNPPDADGKLDLSKVGGVALGDLAQIGGVFGSPELASALNLRTGAHVMYLDDFTVLEEALPGAYQTADGAKMIDSGTRPQIGWASIGISGASRLPVPERGLQAEYLQATGKIAALVRFVPRGLLAGTTSLRLKASSSKAVTLLVQLMEAGGGKFNGTLELPAGGDWKEVSLEYASMDAAEDSAVKDRRVKPELVTGLVVLDVLTLLGGGSEQENVLRLAAMRAQ